VDPGATRNDEVCHFHTNTSQEMEEAPPMMDLDEEEQAMYLLNAPGEGNDIKYPNQMMKVLLGFGGDAQSTHVKDNCPVYGDCVWPCKLSRYTWFWSPPKTDFETVMGVDDFNQPNTNFPDGVRTIEISKDTHKIVMVEHYDRDPAKRQTAESIMCDLMLKCPGMVTEMIVFRKNTALVRMNTDLQAFANLTKVTFGYNVTRYDTAERVKVSKVVSAPVVLVKAPRDCPLPTIKQFVGNFGDVVSCTVLNRNMMECSCQVIFKHVDSAKLLQGLKVNTSKGRMLTGTTGSQELDKQYKLEGCKTVGCTCGSSRTTMECVNKRKAVVPKVIKKRLTIEDLDKLEQECSSKLKNPNLTDLERLRKEAITRLQASGENLPSPGSLRERDEDKDTQTTKALKLKDNTSPKGAASSTKASN